MRTFKKIIIGSTLVLAVGLFSAFKSDFFEVAKQIEIYTNLFKELNLYYIDEINPGKLTDEAINEMLNNLDPYTRFYDEQSVEEAKINSLGEYSGIGVETRFFDKQLIITEIYQGYAADKANIKVGDEIKQIDGVQINDQSEEQIHSLLNGAADSQLLLEIVQNNKPKKVQLKREKIELNPVPHYQLIDGHVGYIPLTKFNSKASASVKKALVNLKTEGMTSLILDLRGNLGGLLIEAVNIANLFVPKGETIVYTKAKLKKWSETYRTRNEPVDLEIPLVVLIDGTSASASEIVAGSLQDLDRAVVIGQRSFGKGLVQRYRDLSYGTKMKLTISKYYTPSGRNIQELDYTNREGKYIPKFSDQKINAFKTKGGRTVYDGGGIAPDIAIKLEALSKSAEALLASDALFKFAGMYNLPNGLTEAQNFSLKAEDYQSFIQFLSQGSHNFKTQSEKHFEQSFNTAKNEDLAQEITPAYQALQKEIKEKKIAALSSNSPQIKDALAHAIVNRYFYKKGEYQYQITHHPSIKKAVELLNNPNQYQKILSNDK